MKLMNLLYRLIDARRVDNNAEQVSFPSLLLTPVTHVAKYGQQIRAAYCAQTPVHLVVVMTANLPSKAWEEAFAATSALIQNIQLLAWEQHIGVVWKTSPLNENPLFCEAIGVTSEEKIVGTLHMGYFNAEDQPMPKPRTPLPQLLHLIDH